MEKLLLDSIPFPVFSVNHLYEFTGFNKACADFMKNRYGVSIETGHISSEYYSEKKDWNQFKQKIDRALNGEEFVEIESWKEKNNPQKYSEILFNPIRDIESNITGVSVVIKDITEYKTNELLLQQNDSRFEALFNKAPLGYQSLDINGCFIEVNQQWLDTLGFERDEVIGKWFGDFLTPMYQDGFRKRFPIFKAQGHIHSEFEMVHKNGAILFIAFDGRIGYNSLGEFKQTHCILQDITEKRKSDIALKESETQYKNLANSGLSLTWTSGTDKLCNYFNETWLKFTGRTLEQEMGNGWAEGVHPDDFDKCLETYVSAFDKREAFEMEYRLRHVSGEYRWILDLGTPNYNSKNEFVGYIGNCFDITERKQIEVSLLEAEWKFKALFELGPIGVAYHRMIYDEAGKPFDYYFIDANDSYNKLTGVSPKGMTVRQAFPGIENDPFDWIGKFGHVAKTGETIRFEQFLEANGRWYDCAGYQYKPDHFVVAFNEITERKKAEKALQESEEKYRLFTENSGLGVGVYSPDGKVILYNQKALKDMGGVAADFVGKSIFEIFDTDSAKIYYNRLQKALEQEKSTEYEDYVSLPTSDYWYLSNFTRIKNDKNEIIAVQIISKDISERRRAEQALSVSEEKFKKAFTTSPDAIAISRIKDGLFVSINTGFTRITGYTEEDILDKDPTKINIWADLSDRDMIVKDLAENVNVENMISKFRTKSGELIIGMVSATIIELSGEKHLLSIMRDITDIKIAEKVLAESERRFRELLSIVQMISVVLDTKGDIVYINNYLLEITGWKNEEIIGKNWFKNFLPSYIFDTVSEVFAKITKTNNITTNYENTILTKSGKELLISWNNTALYDENGELNSIASLGVDITERKRAEKALQESEHKLSALFNGMAEMTVIHELTFDDKNQPVNYRIIDCNQAYTKITGIEPKNALGKLATEVYGTEQAPYLQEYATVCATGANLEYKTYFAPLDKHFLISAVSIGTGRFATITADITDIQKVQEVIVGKNKELENYLYVASHDLRSPLVNIQGFSQRLEQQTRDLKKIIENALIDKNLLPEIDKLINENIQKSLRFILSNVTKMDALINGLLQLSRTGKIGINIKKIDVNKLFQNIVATFNYQLTECDASVKIENLSDCYGDENQLNQLFSNLISNAFKYKDKERKLCIVISSVIHFNKVIYSVKDTGIGIDTNQINKIWDLFYRIDPLSVEGEGLGLSLSKQIVNKHKGKIWAESVEGVGSTFYAELNVNDFEE